MCQQKGKQIRHCVVAAVFFSWFYWRFVQFRTHSASSFIRKTRFQWLKWLWRSQKVMAKMVLLDRATRKTLQLAQCDSVTGALQKRQINKNKYWNVSESNGVKYTTAPANWRMKLNQQWKETCHRRLSLQIVNTMAASSSPGPRMASQWRYCDLRCACDSFPANRYRRSLRCLRDSINFMSNHIKRCNDVLRLVTTGYSSIKRAIVLVLYDAFVKPRTSMGKEIWSDTSPNNRQTACLHTL